MVPGVGDGTNMCSDWIPGARHLFEAAESTTVVLWKGYDNPADLLAAAAGSIECTDVLVTAALDLTEFVASLPIGPEHSVTIVAHSFGSVVTGAALADCGLRCTDVVVAGSPGMTVDDLRQLHMEQSHFFAEQAPGDAIAELGIFGTAPSAPTFGGQTAAHERARPSRGARALALLRARVAGPGEHRGRGHGPLRRRRQPPLDGGGDGRRPRRLVPPPPRRAGAGGRAGTITAPVSAC